MADAERQAPQTSAATADNVSTPRVDERREALSDASVHTDRAAASRGTPTALLGAGRHRACRGAAGARVDERLA